MVTRTNLYPRLAQELGGETGSISSGTATTAVLAGLVGTHEDDYFNGDLLIMPDAANAGDRERVITDWTGSTGTATWGGARTDTTYTSETFFILPAELAFTLTRIQDAIDEVLRETRQTVRNILPTIDGAIFYPLSRFGWIRGAGDVSKVWYRASPNLLDNSSFEVWDAGPGSSTITANPTSWTLAGAGGIIYRAITNAARGRFASQIVRAGTNLTLTQSIGLLNQQLAKPTDETAAITRDITVRAIGISTVTSGLRIQIDDGSGQTNGTYLAANTFDRFTATRTLAAAATLLDIIIQINTTDHTARVDHVVAVEGTTIPQTLIDYGDEGYALQDVQSAVINMGGVPTVALVTSQGRGGQIVIESRMPYPALTADALESDAFAALVEHGTLFKMASKFHVNRDQTKFLELRARHGAAYSRLAELVIDIPPKQPMPSVVVTGA